MEILAETHAACSWEKQGISTQLSISSIQEKNMSKNGAQLKHEIYSRLEAALIWTKSNLLIRRKPIESLSAGENLHRHFTAFDIFLFGVAAIVGAGIFVLTGQAAAGGAGPGISLSFIFAALVCALVGLAYAEMASMIPISGSAYSYTYATMGEFIAFIIAWDLILEYALGASAVAVGWSEYLGHILESLNIALPRTLTTAPADGNVPWHFIAMAVFAFGCGFFLYEKIKSLFVNFNKLKLEEKLPAIAAAVMVGSFVLAGCYASYSAARELQSINLPSALILIAISWGLTRGVKETAKYTAIMVAIKLAVIALVLAVGGYHIAADGVGDHWTPFLPNGWSGVVTGASIVFFAYIGFDAVPTMAEECVNPQRDLPRGMLGSLAVCTILYVLMSLVMTGTVAYTELGTAAPIATVLDAIGQTWAVMLASIGALAGLTSVLIVLLYGQSRITMKLSQDGLITPYLSAIDERYKTPYRAITVIGFFVALPAALLPIAELAELVSIGTLAAFVLVCGGVIILRYAEPDRVRHFRCPGAPVTPALGLLGCLYLMFHLPLITWMRFIIWMVVAIGIYFSYGKWHSKLIQ